MSEFLTLNSYIDERGVLTSIEDNLLPFKIKRVYYMFNLNHHSRGGHCHRKNTQAIVCLSGGCVVEVRTSCRTSHYTLDDARVCLIILPHEWHLISHFQPNTILLVLASTNYDESDYYTEIENEQT